MTIVKDYIDAFALEYDHPYADSVILKYVNQVEQNVFTDTIKEYLIQYYARTLNEFQYSLPAGVDFTSVLKVYVNGKPYKKKDVRANKELYSYWCEGGKLCIYPACSTTDLSYVSATGEITFGTNSITTSGDDFTISVGDVVLVSGCTVNTDNNKYATVIGKADKTLTFASDTFTAGAETDVVTISVPKIKLVYENIPQEKLIANINTDTLLISGKFQDIYDYYCMAKIAYLQKDYDEAANHMSLYNRRVAEYQQWYEDHRPQNPEIDMIPYDDIGYSSNSFDNE